MIDPKPRKRKGVITCAVCPAPLNEVTIRWDDPFCSTVCARSYHGVELPAPVRGIPVAASC